MTGVQTCALPIFVVDSGDNAGETVAGCRCEEVRQTTEIHLTDDEASE